MTELRLKLGAWGEEQAAQFLSRQGVKILHRNFRTPVGEIDIIARHGKILLFIEVKTRSSASCGMPAEAVGATKQRQIIRTAEWYLQQQKPPYLQPRFDVISLLLNKDQVEIEHIKNAFEA